MAIEGVGFLPPLQDLVPGESLERARPSGAPDFADWMTKELGAINSKIAGSDQLLQRLATGEVDNLHQVMVSLEEAKLSFQLLVQVRNKLLEAYQDILRMQV